MQQRERSERSREKILEAALRLFSRQGYRGTSIREIADAAGISTGNLYHQFPDKESLFRTLLGQYWRAIESPDFPFNRALAKGAFPDDLEALGRAARESVRRYRSYVALIYVDVVEFEGLHIRRFYQQMAQRFATFMARHPGRTELRDKLRNGVSPLSAIMLVSRFLLHYYSVELVFGVPDHFGKDTDTVLREIADILRHGMLRPDAGALAQAPARRRRA
jgi:TetR/AcrR family transcriptional regulator, acrAB operon repressor